MKKPAVIICWPLHLDFPICRWNLTRFQKYFASINIAFSDHHVEGINLSNFLRAELPFCNFIEPKREGDDWRDDAVNNVLDKITTNEPILFLEQDFLIKDDSFFDKVLSSDSPFIYFKEGDRIHPAFAIVNRDLIEATARDFSTVPEDHFYKFFSQLPEGVDIETLGVVKKEDFYHMAGLSQNYQNFKYEDPFYNPNNFLYYNFKSLQLPHQHPLFKSTQQAIENKYGHPPHHKFLNLFFPDEG